MVLSVAGRWLSGTPLAECSHGSAHQRRLRDGADGDGDRRFRFLPYCQARRGNIVVDTFTSWLPARINAFIDAFWDLVYAGMMGLITACLMTGVIEHYRSGQTTMLLQAIVWPALAVCTLLSLILTCCRHRDGRDTNPAGPSMSGVAIAILGFGAMLVLIAVRMPVGLSMLVVGSIGYIHLSSWPCLLRLHEDQPLLSVRQLHAVRHSAVHPDGRAGRAGRHVHRPVPRGAGLRRGISAADWRWR